MTEPHHDLPKTDKVYWLDQPKNITRLLWLLAAACVLVGIADGLYIKHPHFGVERVFGFYAWYGFVCFVFIVFAGKALRKLVMRDEDYYDR